ncbi:MAG: hypothetical protein ACJ73S_27765 [Mycobacteriales bacterium]
MSLYDVLRHEGVTSAPSVALPSPYGPLRLDVYGSGPAGPLTPAEAADVAEAAEAARARWRDGAFAAAEVQLIEVVTARPYAAEAYGALAEMALAGGRPDEALYHTRQLVALAQTFPSLQLLATVLAALGRDADTALVLGHLWEGRAQAPWDIREQVVADLLAALDRLGDTAALARVAATAYAERHLDPTVRYFHAAGLAATGDLLEAAACLADALDALGEADDRVRAPLEALGGRLAGPLEAEERRLSAGGALTVRAALYRALSHREPPRSPRWVRCVTPYGALRLDLPPDGAPVAGDLVVPGEEPAGDTGYLAGTVRRALAAAGDGDGPQALRLAHTLAGRYPYRPEPYRLLADYHLGQGNPAEAVYHLRQLVAVAPTWSALLPLAKALLQADRRGQALEVLAALWDRRRDAPDTSAPREAFAAYLTTLLGSGDPADLDRAVAVGTSARDDLGGHPDAAFLLACAYGRAGDRAAAFAALDRAAGFPASDAQAARMEAAWYWLDAVEKARARPEGQIPPENVSQESGSPVR